MGTAQLPPPSPAPKPCVTIWRTPTVFFSFATPVFLEEVTKAVTEVDDKSIGSKPLRLSHPALRGP